jgi:hypothetical protein
LHQRTESRETSPQIGYTCGNPNLRVGWRLYHRARHSNTTRNISMSALPSIRTLPFASSIWMALAAFGAIAAGTPEPLATIAVVSALSETFTGNSPPVGCTFPPSNPR